MRVWDRHGRCCTALAHSVCLSVSDFDRFSLTIARWLTNVYDEDNPAKNYTTPGDVARPTRL